MYVAISVFILIISALMMLVVLVQNSKGGGLVSNLSSSNQILGVRKTTDFLEKATWTLAIVLVGLCLFSSSFSNSSKTETTIESAVSKTYEKTLPASTYQMPTTENAE